MGIPYPEVIRESVDELSALEKEHRNTRLAPRVQLLRLLKSGEKRSLAQAAKTVGYSHQQAERWWRFYKEEGISALLAIQPWGGREEYMTLAAWAGLRERLEAGHLPTLEDVRRYRQEEWQVAYRKVSSISSLFQRHGIRKKTGRRRHRKADAASQAAFKKLRRAYRWRRSSGCHRRGTFRNEGLVSSPLVSAGRPSSLDCRRAI